MNQTSDFHTVSKDDDDFDLVQIIKIFLGEKERLLRNCVKAIGIWLVALIIYSLVSLNFSTYYSLVLGINFPQAAQGKYPNGASFSASDIVSNTVLEKVWADNHLADRGVKFQEFQNSVSAIPYTGEINFIDTKYKILLAQKNLTRTDIEKIETDYRAEVEQASSKNIKLILDGKDSGYDLTFASKVLNDIASTWSKTAIEKLGVSRSPALDGLVLNAQMKTESPFIVVNYLNDVIFKAQSIIALMQLDPNSNSYRDEETGFNLSGISSKLAEIANYQVDQLDAFVAINTKISDLEQLQAHYKIQELKEQRTVLLLKAESNQRALNDYTGSKNQGSSVSSDLRARSSASSDSSGVQINGDAITKLFSLATESKDAEYRQKLTSERIALEGNANDLNQRIAKLERRLNYAQNKSANTSGEIKTQYAILLDKTWNNLTSAIDAIGRIQVMAQKDFMSDSGLLFTVINQPSSHNPGSIALMKAALISFFVFVVLGLLFTFTQIYFDGLFKSSELTSDQ